MTAEQAAQEALSLKANEWLTGAIHQIRQDALEGLARTPATDIEAIRDHQATVRNIDNLMAKIELAIASGKTRKTSGVA